mmetsp:Transcript_68997/g.223717  ORF Transcript_68997/g.223717 Transcript_68997/m.223717 type:complete len:277 (+) Transcript_68997:592-1422(+)
MRAATTRPAAKPTTLPIFLRAGASSSLAPPKNASFMSLRFSLKSPWSCCVKLLNCSESFGCARCRRSKTAQPDVVRVTSCNAPAAGGSAAEAEAKAEDEAAATASVSWPSPGGAAAMPSAKVGAAAAGASDSEAGASAVSGTSATGAFEGEAEGEAGDWEATNRSTPPAALPCSNASAKVASTREQRSFSSSWYCSASGAPAGSAKSERTASRRASKAGSAPAGGKLRHLRTSPDKSTLSVRGSSAFDIASLEDEKEPVSNGGRNLSQAWVLLWTP